MTTAAGTTAMPQDETDSGAATNLPSAVIMVLLQVLFLISLQWLYSFTRSTFLQLLLLPMHDNTLVFDFVSVSYTA